jgi:ankyrin repeat protein
MLLLLAALIGFAVYSEIRQRTRTSAENNSDPLIEEKKPETDAAQKTEQAGALRKIDIDLLSEAGWGHTEKVRDLLAYGAEINARDINGDTPLIVASFLGFSDTVKLLLAKGADVNATNNLGSTALIEAATMNKPETVELLLSNGADVSIKNLAGLTALDASIKENHKDMVNLLRTGVANKPAQSASYMAFDAGLQQAAIEGDTGKIRNLLASGANVNARNKDGWTALMHASFQGNTAAVALLLASSADPNQADSKYGRTALILATRQGHTGVVQALLKGGADPNAKDKAGETPMSIVQQTGNRHLGLLLKQAGAKAPAYNQILTNP